MCTLCMSDPQKPIESGCHNKSILPFAASVQLQVRKKLSFCAAPSAADRPQIKLCFIISCSACPVLQLSTVTRGARGKTAEAGKLDEWSWWCEFLQGGKNKILHRSQKISSHEKATQRCMCRAGRSEGGFFPLGVSIIVSKMFMND